MEQISDNMDDGETGEGGEVLDGLYSGVQLPDLSECGRPGPAAQLRPLHGHEVSTRCLPEGRLRLTRAKDAPPSQFTRTSDKDAGGKNLC